MKLLIQYAMQHVGLPYIWGGDDSIKGFDCSGFVQELLASVGMDPPGDQTAQSLFVHFYYKGSRDVRGAGSLAFYGTQQRVTHVGFMLDHKRIIEAAGGNSRTKTVQQAINDNAYIRIRPYDYRSDLVSIVRPQYHASMICC